MKRLLDLTKVQWIVFALTLAGVYALVYAPHIGYRFPYHIDEWHHIAEGLRLGNYGEYFEMLRRTDVQRFSGMEIGFHFFVFLASFVADVVTLYQFLPALWAVFSAATIFFVAYQLSNKRFFVGWLAAVFFAAIKSNVNVTGLWFFTPLTFAIPFLYLYTYLLYRGFDRESPKMIAAALGLMVFLTPIHSISVLFFLPTLVCMMALRWRFVIRIWYVFLSFLLLPLIGLTFYKFVLKLPWLEVAKHLFTQLQFRYGWGVLELQNPIFDLYPWVGMIAALGGAGWLAYRGDLPRLALYCIWPIAVGVSLVVYRLTGVSFLSPYQRNLYYLVLILPIFSAFGVAAGYDFLRVNIADALANARRFVQKRSAVSTGLASACVGAVIAMSFATYYIIPERIQLYRVIEEADYRALKSLSAERPKKVMAPPLLAMAVYPIAGADPVGAVAFYGDLRPVLNFFQAGSCDKREGILSRNNVDYIITHDYFDCRAQLIYDKDYVYLYRVR